MCVFIYVLYNGGGGVGAPPWYFIKRSGSAWVADQVRIAPYFSSSALAKLSKASWGGGPSLHVPTKVYVNVSPGIGVRVAIGRAFLSSSVLTNLGILAISTSHAGGGGGGVKTDLLAILPLLLNRSTAKVLQRAISGVILSSGTTIPRETGKSSDPLLYEE